MEGMLFDIQHFSIHDGPGIRTTVFFKGCNLKCHWCHNPESQSFKSEIMIDDQKCIKCGACIKACENDARKIIDNQVVVSSHSCIKCGKCADVCYSNAINFVGHIWTVEEVMEEIQKDASFYRNSGGGVTFSGGETMLQIDFLDELLERCKSQGIHTTVDTAGNVPWEYFEKILPKTDLFLYDLKCMGKKQHKKFTGVDNTVIKENLEKLKRKTDVWIRIPCMKGVNDSEEEFQQYLGCLHCVDRIKRIELLPYHSYGERKYTMLGRSVPDFEPMEHDVAETLKKKLETKGFLVCNYC